ncbi:MAG: DUF892 family protein [Clostridia bacterium]|jgi:ferritin-like metal-binding protein YciE|nr:DUF892 family protein [Clostridia bacterium]
MDKNVKPNDERVLTDIYKTCKMGLESIAKLMPETQNQQMRCTMGEHLKEYQTFAARAAQCLAESGKAPEDAGFWEKIPAEVGMAVSRMMDSSDSKTAQMMINGYVMGVTELKKQQSEVAGLSEPVVTLVSDMLSFQLQAINDMKQYL